MFDRRPFVSTRRIEGRIGQKAQAYTFDKDCRTTDKVNVISELGMVNFFHKLSTAQ